MALHPLSGIELFSGVGMLGEGLRAGFAHLGITYRAVCHVEREAYAAGVVVARMEEGSMDAAPVWSDVTTFDAAAWRGKVDCIVAGFPCQDLSVAGRRAGLDGKRSGLFFEVVRIAADCGACFMLLENVAGIASATASVMDEAEGELDERAASRVVGELADCGWDAEWITLSASDVGASHGRARWFCLARRMADAARHERDGSGDGQGGCGRGICEASNELGDAASDGRREGWAELPGRSGRSDSGGAGLPVDDTSPTGRRHTARADESGIACMEEQGCSRRGECGGDVVGRPEFVGSVLADASSTRQQGRELGRACDCNGGGQEAHGSTSQLCGLFAPGPADPRWAGIIRDEPWLSPALSIEGEHDASAAFAAAQSLLCGTPDGLAAGLDFDHRAQRLKCVGNGVVALCAAAAVVVLVRRAGITKGGSLK